MPLTHFDAEGKARMVDVTEKKEYEKQQQPERSKSAGTCMMRLKRNGRKRRCAFCGDHSRDHGCETDGGSDSDVSYPADHEL